MPPKQSARANSAAPLKGQPTITNFFQIKNNSNITINNNINVTVNNSPVRIDDAASDEEAPSADGAQAAGGQPTGTKAAASGAVAASPPVQAPLARAAASSPPRHLPAIVQKACRVFFDVSLQMLAMFVLQKRFLMYGWGKFEECARFLNSHRDYRAFFGPRKLENGAPFTGVLGSDIRRWYHKHVVGKKKKVPLRRGFRFGDEVMAFFKKAVEKEMETIGGEKGGQRKPFTFHTLTITIDAAKHEAYKKGLITEEQRDWRVGRATLYRWCNHWGFSFRRATSGSTLPDNWPELRLDLAARVCGVAHARSIPPYRIYNADQCAINLVPNAGCARALVRRGERGSVRVIGSGDKRQVTAVTLCDAGGGIGPVQIVYKGKTARSLPTAVQLKPLRDVHGHATYTPNRWASVKTMIKWVDDLFVPHAQRRSVERGDPADAPCILLLDCWHGHTSPAFRAHIREKYPWIFLLFIPANCTSKLQPCDVAVQRPFKAGIVEAYTRAIHEQVGEELKKPDGGGGATAIVKRLLSVPKLRGQTPAWVVAGMERAAAARAGTVETWQKIFPHLTDCEYFATTARQRIEEKGLLHNFSFEPDGEEEADGPTDEDVQDRLAAAIAGLALPMKRRRRNDNDDEGNKKKAEDDEEEEMDAETTDEEDDGVVRLTDDEDDDDEVEKSSDVEEGIDAAEEEGAAADDVDDARAALDAAKIAQDPQVRTRLTRLAAQKCNAMLKKKNKQGRL